MPPMLIRRRRFHNGSKKKVARKKPAQKNKPARKSRATEVLIPLRKDRRRKNRIFAQFLMTHCWAHQVDCIFISRDDLMGYFGVDNIQQTYFTWLQEDVESWFPYYEPLEFQYRGVPASIILSRLPIDPYIAHGQGRDSWRASLMSERGLECATIGEIFKGGLPHFENMIEELSMCLTGLKDFKVQKKRARKRKHPDVLEDPTPRRKAKHKYR